MATTGFGAICMFLYLLTQSIWVPIALHVKCLIALSFNKQLADTLHILDANRILYTPL